MTVLPETKLDALLARHAMVEAELSRQVPAETYVKLSREFAEIDPVVEKVKAYREAAAEIADLEALIADPATDPAMRDMAGAEKPALEAKREALAQELRLALIPKDAMDERSRSAPAPAATRLRCSRATCSACTSATPRSRAGKSR